MTTTKNEDDNVGYSITSDEGDNNETIMRTRATTKTQGDDEGEPNGKDDDDHRDDDGKHEDADDEGDTVGRRSVVDASRGDGCGTSS